MKGFINFLERRDGDITKISNAWDGALKIGDYLNFDGDPFWKYDYVKPRGDVLKIPVESEYGASGDICIGFHKGNLYLWTEEKTKIKK